MGYQESMIPIGCLAEAEGIKDGIESYRRVHGCGLFYYCAASERYTGQLYACVGGDRYPYQSMPGPFPMIYLDDILGWDGEQAYGDHFDDLPQSDVSADVPKHLEEMFLARSNMIEYLRSVDREMEADSRERNVPRAPDYEGELEGGEYRCSAYSDLIETPLGYFVAVGDGSSLCGLKMQDADRLYDFNATLAPAPKGRRGWFPDPDTEPFPQLRDWLNKYFLDERPDPEEVPIDPFGTDAKRAIFSAICEIPYGGLATYSEIAKAATAARGKRVSPAVVHTVAQHNPLPILIPSHRVISAAGQITEVQGSASMTAWLLGHEKADLTRVRLPYRLQMPEHPVYDIYRFGKHDLPEVLRHVKGTFGLEDAA